MLFRRNFKKFIVFIFTIVMTISFANVKKVMALSKSVLWYDYLSTIYTYVGQKPKMPSTVQVYWSDDSSSVEYVDWNLSTVNLNNVGRTTVTGKLKSYPNEEAVTVDVVVEEDEFDYFINEPDNIRVLAGQELKSLPSTVSVKWKSGRTTTEKITWNVSNYELRKDGSHAVTGDVSSVDQNIFISYEVNGDRDLWDYDEDLNAYVYSDKLGYKVKNTWKLINGKYYYFNSNTTMAANEWIDGYWLNKDGSWTYKAKASWHKNKQGWWFGDTSGWYAKKEWIKIDGSWYYFNKSGYIATNEYIDNYYLSASGKLVGSKYTWEKAIDEWYYWDENYNRLEKQWAKIDNQYYYFDEFGFMVHDVWVNGCWLSSDGVWRYKPKGYWVKVGKYSWKYKDTSGWQAKNTTLMIDGEYYYFDKKGITYIYY